MKIVVLGGTGLIGRQLLARLRHAGHTAESASPSSGVNALTAEGLAAALEGADTLVDVTNSPSFEDRAVRHFFETSTHNLLAAAREAGTRHYVALSVVGADRLPDSGYLRAKVLQERLIAGGGIPSTIVRATQFFEFLAAVAQGSTTGDAVRVPPAFMQPIASADVAAALADTVLQPPVNGVVDIAGPERIRMDTLLQRVETGGRPVIADPAATYFGAALAEDSLVPLGPARLGPTTLAQWQA